MLIKETLRKLSVIVSGLILIFGAEDVTTPDPEMSLLPLRSFLLVDGVALTPIITFSLVLDMTYFSS